MPQAIWDALPYVGLVVGLAATMVLLVWGTARVRRRGSGGLGGVMAAYGEVWSPTSHDSHYELKEQEEKRAEAAVPDGGAGDGVRADPRSP
ncbi:MAG TPA: hypothetical protein VGF17_06825 [Phytomonospora sp.]